MPMFLRKVLFSMYNLECFPLLLSIERCTDYMNGEPGKWGHWPDYCCGIYTRRYCCSECSQEYTTTSCPTISFGTYVYVLYISIGCAFWFLKKLILSKVLKLILYFTIHTLYMLNIQKHKLCIILLIKTKSTHPVLYFKQFVSRWRW